MADEPTPDALAPDPGPESGMALTTVPATPPPPTVPPTEPADGEAVMTLVDHLGELRSRIFRIVLAVAVGSVVGFYFARSDHPDPRRPLPAGRSSSSAPATRSSST